MVVSEPETFGIEREHRRPQSRGPAQRAPRRLGQPCQHRLARSTPAPPWRVSQRPRQLQSTPDRCGLHRGGARRRAGRIQLHLRLRRTEAVAGALEIVDSRGEGFELNALANQATAARACPTTPATSTHLPIARREIVRRRPAELCSLDTKARSAIERTNALALFPRLGTPPSPIAKPRIDQVRHAVSRGVMRGVARLMSSTWA